MDFLGGVGTEVVGGLIVAAVLALVAVLRSSPRRKRLQARARKRLCVHDWQPIETDLGGGLQLVTRWSDYCTKCGERR